MATVTTALSPNALPVSDFLCIKPLPSPVRVLTVDEHSLVREGLGAVIRQDSMMQVVGEAGSGAEAIEAFRRLHPDVMTLGLFLPDIPGEEVARQILAEFPDAKIVAITGARGDAHILRALESGVRGLVLKGGQHGELLSTIRQVHSGKRAIPRQVAEMLAEHFGDESLTLREVQVLRLVARGNRNKQVAAQLCIAEETVRMHMKNILAKLSAHDRTHAVTIALSRGIIQLEGHLSLSVAAQ
jgi:DNA-binding NarL/FixJ family response regulator